MSEQKLEIFNVLNFLDNGYELEKILKEGKNLALYLRKSVWPSELCGVQPAQTPVQRIRCQSAPSNVP